MLPIDLDDLGPVPLPSRQTQPEIHRTSEVTSAIFSEGPERTALFRKMLERSGLNVIQASERMGIDYHSLSQYLNNRRVRPSMWWFLRLAKVCGATLYLEFPKEPVK